MRGRLERRTWRHNPTLDAPPRYRRACAYEAFVPDAVAGFEASISAPIVAALSEAETAIGQLNATSHRELAPLARLLLRTESIASSKVEGLQVDARTLARAEAKQETGRPVGLESAEILANIDAMEVAIERAAESEAITADLIVGIHQRLMERDPRGITVGRLRDEQNWIGGNDYNPCGADFVPPPPDYVAGLLADLCEFCNDDRTSPLLQAAVAHAQFETIHPFQDGNGRTGRALVQVILRRRGLAPHYVPPISVALAARREWYIEGLGLFRADRLDEWLERFATASAQAARLATRYLVEVEELKAGWRDAVRAEVRPRADAAVWTLIEALPAHPVISLPVAAAATGRTRPAVSAAVEQLVAAGVLRRLGESARNRAWEADGLLELVVQLEAARMPPSRLVP